MLSRDGKLARLGAHGEDAVLLELEELPFVLPIRERSRLGLYHTAFVLPSRADLSRFVRHLWELGVGFAAGDHAVSEALYLVDPDGLEVEVYADRPRETWQWVGGELRMGTWPVKLAELAAVTADSGTIWQGAPAGTRVGHVHLYVGSLRLAEQFYCQGLGLDIMVRIPSALFTSAGGYHHHVGLNVWAAASPVAGEADARLLYWEMMLPDSVEVERVSARLLAAGYAETVSASGERAFVDDAGITVALVVGDAQAA
jgi:catechol 2,3-dioxygenase